MILKLYKSARIYTYNYSKCAHVTCNININFTNANLKKTYIFTSLHIKYTICVYISLNISVELCLDN